MSPLSGRYFPFSNWSFDPDCVDTDRLYLVQEGKITLTSNDPFASPTIDPNYMNHSFDKAAVLQGMKDVFEFITTSPLAGFVAEPLGELATADSDAKLLAYAQATGVTENHGCGTARMTTKGADGGVIDPAFRVKGVHGVAIVDASIFVSAPVIMSLSQVSN